MIVNAQAKVAEIIHPEDEENLGYLKIVQPNWNGQQQIPVALSVRGSTATDSTFRLLDGLHSFDMSSSVYNAKSSPIKITKKETTTYRLAAIHPHFDLKSFEVSFGPKAQLVVNTGEIAFDWNSSASQAYNFYGDFLANDFWSGRANSYVMVLSEKHNFSFYPPIIGVYSKTFEGGDIRELDLNVGEKRTTLRITTPKRYFPDPYPDYNLRNHLISGTRRLALEDNSELGFTIDQPQTRSGINTQLDLSRDETTLDFKGFSLKGTELRLSSNSNQFVVSSYMMTINGTTKSYFNMHSDEIINQKIKRIDVDDVKVRKEDGSFYYAKGVYTIQRTDVNEKVCISLYGNESYSCYYNSFPTRTGLDVLPGKYKVIINYSTLENTNESQEFNLDLN